MYPELDNLTLSELVEKFYGKRPEEDDDGDGVVYYSEVALQMMKHASEGIDFLLEAYPHCNLGQQRGILQALSVPPCLIAPGIDDLVEPRSNDPRINHLVESSLDDPRPIIVADAIRTLAHWNKADLINRVLSLRNHPCEYVRGSVLYFINKLHPEQALPLLLDALHDPHYIVRETAIDELDDLGDVSAIPEIEPLLNDPEASVRQAARTAIENLTDRLHHPEEYPEE